ncbi:sigma 54-interacting transcriptional regulator [Neptunitalea lumnitzerae]|uniref:Magnesium chelatase n=1 Tax=Neptunitalea lumnitzerae TaxID=2965509 RepID=A0ABQ5MJD0_9FLAO|nr:sigma 54-interacting transcriptional regulator [Neptunitalea sp. Y10]GLB49160.1 magnesium chelatase [Neptunitalea sp. Y10]
MNIEQLKTLGDLKAIGYTTKNIKEELRDNLIQKIKEGEQVFSGIHGYENSVIPELERAILSKHNINLLGLRGQAKTRLARLMTKLLDEYIPYVSGSEIHDDPFQPLSKYAIDLLEKEGDNTPISWLHRSDRFYEKLATPDVTVADLIGDVDPIKAANLKLSYADDRVIHFGMIPRANRCIFVINELPDLQARIQVALFNILQEGDIQIRGFKLRLSLDVQFVFTANPEDYTNRGSIVTPLKDRIGSQILTHYPKSIAIAKTITSQEAKLDSRQSGAIHVPELAKDILEQIGFEARNSDYIDAKSGVSARMSITAYENLLSTAERRALQNGETSTTVRLSDFMGVIPAITGKVELVYEGEQEGASEVAIQLLESAIKTLFPDYFPKIEKLARANDETPYDDLISWFFENTDFELVDDVTNTEYKEILSKVTPLTDLIQKYQKDLPETDANFMKEFVLWGLVAFNKLSKQRFIDGYQFNDLYGNYIRGL